jgi:hypothetical protein
MDALWRAAGSASEGTIMAEKAEDKSQKAAHAGAEAGHVAKPGEGQATGLDLESIKQMLGEHVHEMRQVVADLRNELKLEVAEVRRAEEQITELRENQRRIEGALEQEREESWLVKQPSADRKHLKKIDQELRELEETLEGPQMLLERDDGEQRPLVKREATWQLPKYKPVPPDKPVLGD